VLAGDGEGVATGDGDVVGTAVGLGVLALGFGLTGRVLAGAAGVVADGAGAGVDLAGAGARAGVSVAERAGLTCRYVASATRKMAVMIQVEIRTRRIR
jgi:hypothetical protein